MLIAILAQTRSLADEPIVPIKLKAGAFTPGVDDQSPPDSSNSKYGNLTYDSRLFEFNFFAKAVARRQN
ncbi:MAG: hypothetical protein GY759_09305 [Chloroflexi bacterium]|nr:hypothetical protein [Chloroflexota bacterium]